MFLRLNLFFWIVVVALAQSRVLTAAIIAADEGDKVLAQVGEEKLLARELSFQVDQNMAQLSPQKLLETPNDQFEAARKRMSESQLDHWINVKLLILDAREQTPKDTLEKIEQSLAQEFEKQQLPQFYQQYRVKTRDELEARFRQCHTSLQAQKRSFIEQQIAFG
ncbi:MAG TPA: hypothetical protein VGJ26_00165 [Pirellulales bacterium]|jgi:hypothetical protein